MKKIFLMPLIIISCIVLTGCKSQAVQETEKQINAIGEVSIISGTAICEAEASYGLLSADEQVDVKNYNVLTDARSAYQEIAIGAFREAIENGDYESGNEIVKNLDDTTLKNIGYSLIAYGADNAFGHLFYYGENGKYIDADAISKISGIIDCAKSISAKMDIQEDDELYPVTTFLQEFQDYMNDEVQYLNLTVLEENTDNSNATNLAYSVGRFVSALNSGSRSQLNISYDEIKNYKIDYMEDDVFATQYAEAVNQLRSGAGAIMNGLGAGKSAILEDGISDFKAASNSMVDLNDLIIAEKEARLLLLTEYDDIDSILEKWNPAAEDSDISA